MKVLDSQITLQTSHYKYEKVEEFEEYKEWHSDYFTPSKELHAIDKNEVDELENLDPKLKEMIRVLESLMGIKIDIHIPKGLTQGTQESQLQGWGVEYNYSKTQIKKEHLDFSSSGEVHLKDGRVINFKMAFAMQSQSYKNETFSFKAGDALIDPLVINYSGGSVHFSEITHTLDLDLDAREETFHFVDSGSGFLTLDKNKDGRINNGAELFGPTSGNGFDELQAYDDDGNGWIDENDFIFKKLLIWTKDKEGKESFYTLKEKGIGALYLEHVNTYFDFQTRNNSLSAQMKDTSIFLRENGSVGTIHEIDLAV